MRSASLALRNLLEIDMFFLFGAYAKVHLDSNYWQKIKMNTTFESGFLQQTLLSTAAADLRQHFSPAQVREVLEGAAAIRNAIPADDLAARLALAESLSTKTEWRDLVSAIFTIAYGKLGPSVASDLRDLCQAKSLEDAEIIRRKRFPGGDPTWDYYYQTLVNAIGEALSQGSQGKALRQGLLHQRFESLACICGLMSFVGDRSEILSGILTAGIARFNNPNLVLEYLTRSKPDGEPTWDSVVSCIRQYAANKDPGEIGVNCGKSEALLSVCHPGWEFTAHFTNRPDGTGIECVALWRKGNVLAIREEMLLLLADARCVEFGPGPGSPGDQYTK